MSESKVVNACLRWLLLHGCFVRRNNTGAYKPEGSKRWLRFGYTGSGDIEGMTKSGRFISVECKHGRNKPSAEQLSYGEKVKAHGGIYIVAYSTDDLEANKEVICSDG